MAFINYNPNIIAICSGHRIYFFHYAGEGHSTDFLLEYDLDLELDVATGGEATHSKPDKNGSKAQTNTILCSALSPAFLAVATSTKLLVVLDIRKLNHSSLESGGNASSVSQLSKFCIALPKTPSSMCFSQDDTKILLSDRSGSVYEFEITETGLSKGRELLGHFSMLLDFCLSPNREFIITADRDEKIRVSRYPNTFSIENFCLGHTSFVKTIACIDESHAVSSGGDSVIRLWNYRTGECLFKTLKISDSPIRRVQHTNVKDSATILALPDDCNRIEVFELDKERRTLSRKDPLNCSNTDERLFDFCVDQERQILFCVGRSDIYHCELDAPEPLLRPIPIEGSTATFLDDLARCEDKYPLDELYKVVAFGNNENYQKGKAERKRRRTSSPSMDQ